jgi:MATE family multidrug resistance protein
MMPLTRRAVFTQAWPIILGQALVPLVGIVDAAVIGRTGDAAALAGVALGATIVTLVFWTFGFLRMGVTGLTAQAHGARDEGEVAATLMRALILGGGIGLGLLLLAPLIVPAALQLMTVPAQAEAAARSFTFARFLGAPAALAFYAINGWLLGLGRTRAALACQIALNGINIALDLLFVMGLHMGAPGVGIGTALAEWSALACGLLAARHVLGPGWWRATIRPGTLLAWRPMRRLIAVNADIMIRTLALLVLMTWFARAGARLGTVPLAANHVLMQFVSVSAFVLDGFAFTAEARVGAAIGAGSRAALLRAIRLTGEFSLAGALLFSGLIVLAGTSFIALITHDPAVQAQARAMLPYCALVPLVGMPSWLLDGIFIGATRGRALRNAALAVTAAYLLTDHAMRGLGDAGVWLALLASYAYRAVSLGACLPALVRGVGGDSKAMAASRPDAAQETA